jgi:thioester reductase-like protein
MLKDRVQVLRIGQLCGDTEEGMWNESEGWPLLIKTAQTTGTLPVLQEVSNTVPNSIMAARDLIESPFQNPSWLPVDIAAKSV